MQGACQGRRGVEVGAGDVISPIKKVYVVCEWASCTRPTADLRLAQFKRRPPCPLYLDLPGEGGRGGAAEVRKRKRREEKDRGGVGAGGSERHVPVASGGGSAICLGWFVVLERTIARSLDWITECIADVSPTTTITVITTTTTIIIVIGIIILTNIVIVIIVVVIIIIVVVVVIIVFDNTAIMV